MRVARDCMGWWRDPVGEELAVYPDSLELSPRVLHGQGEPTCTGCGCVSLPQHTCGGQRSAEAHSTIYVPGTELGHQAWWQAPLPDESHLASPHIVF